METRLRFFALLTAALILSGCNDNPVAAEQQAILQRVDKSVDDLQPIESAAGSVCDDLYLRKLYYDEICGSHQKMGESRIASSRNTRIAIRMLVLPTFGRPASARFELASSSKGTVTVRQLSRSVLRDDLLVRSLLSPSAETASSGPFADDVRATFDRASDLNSTDIEKVLMGLNQSQLWGMEFDPYQSSWRYHFRGLLGDNLSGTLLQLVGLDRVVECFDGVTWVIEAQEADRWGAVMRTCRPIGQGEGIPPLALDDLGKVLIQIVRERFPDLDLTARAERSSDPP